MSNSPESSYSDYNCHIEETDNINPQSPTFFSTTSTKIPINNSPDESNKNDSKKEAPQVIRIENGITIVQDCDPDFLPSPLYPEKAPPKNEIGLYYDLIQQCDFYNIEKETINRKHDTVRRHLAKRIAARLYPVLLAMDTELERQDTIRTYIKRYIHDTYITSDNKLHTFINNDFNSMITYGLPRTLAARDV